MIYYVEDDKNIRELAIYALEHSDFETRGFSCAKGFFEACEEELPDLVLLDIMLPEVDGISILQILRNDERTKRLPIMMLTAKGAEIDKVAGLDAGADDYLAKPFGMMELVSRVRALMRRASISSESDYTNLVCGPITLNIDAREVDVGGTSVDLTRKEFDLLQMLMENRGHVMKREQLLQDIWGWDFAGVTRTVDVHIQTLRQKLSDASPKAAQLIETVRGVGYIIRAS